MSTALQLTVEKSYKYSELIKQLDDFYYERISGTILEPGCYSVLGGSIRIFPVNYEKEIRIEFFGSIIESIREKGSDKKKGSDKQKPINKIEIEKNYFVLDDGVKIIPNEYVVNIDHGIGIFRRIGTKEVENEQKKYIFIEYQNGDYLYLPLALKEKVTRYIGVGRKPKLNRLGSQSWENSKKRAYENAILLAKELLHIYAKREVSERQGYKIDRVWDKEIKKTFIHKETGDQLKAIDSVYKDLSLNKPMDRLISGDVGFGKTEVALRAMIQAVANGKQAVIICPTTLLAQQHYTNIISRTDNLPINVSLLSRFVSAEDQKKEIDNIKKGKADIIVGTHRLLSKDIQFMNLDLIVLDEEQRFGVKQKEHFKKLRENINVLSLSATPIPRTLFMALSGIRDISQVSTPPSGRKSIDTEVAIYSEKLISEYISKEVLRHGQVYYLYNNIETMPAKKYSMEKVMPNIQFATANGQMNEKELLRTMKSFINKKYDVLICSTIIENGLDLANVNTLIVENADMFGLSQLYQIRGRVGRSEKQARCLLLYKNKILSEIAYKRLKSLAENTDLGSGFNVALNDLEIRGGGNILGREQHGNMESVGLILYSQLLKNAVKNLSNGVAHF